MEECIKNEKKDSRIEVTASDGSSTVTVSSYVFQVYDADDTSVQAEATASISGNGTATVELYGLVDTTDDAFVVGSSYYVLYTYVIGSETYMLQDWFIIT